MRFLFALSKLLRCLSLISTAAIAQTATDDSAPRQTEPVRLLFESVVDSYRAFSDPPLQSWRETNERVREIGGWRAYAKEFAPAEPAAAQPHQHEHGEAKR
jgi:hypothetical protein